MRANLLDTAELRDVPALEGESNHRPLPEIDNAAVLLAADLPLPPEVIRSVLHQGLKATLGGSSKGMKTWILLDAAVSVCAGVNFWRWKTEKGPVLYINFEIPRAFIARRIRQIAKAKGVPDLTNLDVWTLRGHAASLGVLLPSLSRKLSLENMS